jgi:hypothetical protein
LFALTCEVVFRRGYGFKNSALLRVAIAFTGQWVLVRRLVWGGALLKVVIAFAGQRVLVCRGGV